MFKTATPATKALDELRKIARQSVGPLKIIESALAEVQATDGRNERMNEVTLERACSSEANRTLREARDAVIADRLDAERAAQPIIQQVEAWEHELARLHEENIELVRSRVYEAIRGPLGEPLARKCSYLAPSVTEEQSFQAKHVVSHWANRMRQRFMQASPFDGVNVADCIAGHFAAIESTALVIKEHSEELRKRLGVDAS